MPTVPKPPAKSAPSPAQRGGAGEPVTGLRVSLMPVETGAVAPQRRYAIILVAALLVETMAFGAAWAGLSYLVKTRRETSDHAAWDIAAAMQAVIQQGPAIKEAEDFARRVDALAGRLDAHAYWPSLFELIERTARPNVTYASFAGDVGTGVVSLEAAGRTYRDIAEQIVLMRAHPLVADVRANSAITMIGADGEITGVTFTLLAKFKPEAWKKAAAAQ